MKRYEVLAQEFSELIRSGALPAGARLPSVRETSRSRRVSPSTVFEAWYLLQARGLVESRPRSGFYVRADPTSAAKPARAVPPPRSRAVAVSDLVFDVLATTRRADLVPLGSAFPSADLFPLAQLARAMARGLRSLPPARIVDDLPPGNERLRRQIALRYARAGVEVDADDILITNGALEALTLSLQVVTRPGDAVVVESPTFYAALQALARSGLRAIELPCHPATGLDLASLSATLRRQRVAACWLMPSFQNPLGSTMPTEHRRELVSLLAAHDVPLIDDDVYAELHHGPHPPVSAKAFDRKGLVLTCGSFSKCLAPGYRVGWVVGGRHAQALERAKIMTTLATAVPSQQALAEYLDHGGYDRHLRSLRRTLGRQCDFASRLATRLFPAGTRLSAPEGGYFLWVEFPTHVDTLQLHAQALEQGISTAPGRMFSAAPHFGHCLRLNFGHPRDPRFEPALRTVADLVAAQRA